MLKFLGAGGGLLKLTFGLTALNKVTGGVIGRLSALVVTFVSVRFVVGTLTSKMKEATQSIKAFGEGISDIRGRTGLGTGGAYGMLRNYRAFGLSGPGETTNPLMLAQMNRAWGLGSPTGAGYISGMARRYQGMDPFMREAMLQSLGIDSPEMRRTLMSPTGMLQHQERFARGVEAGFGVDPREAERLSQRLNMVNLQFRALSEGVLQKLAVTILPRVLTILKNIADRAGANTAEMGDNIERYVDIAFTKLIQFAEFVLRLPEYFAPVKTFFLDLADHLLDVAETLSNALPSIFQGIVRGISVAQNVVQMFLRGGMAVMNYIRASIANAVEAAITSWAAIQEPMARFFESVSGFAHALVGVADMIYNSPLIRAFIDRVGRAAPTGQRLIKGAAQAGNVVANTVEGGARAAGASESDSALLALLAPVVGARVAWGLLRRGAARIGTGLGLGGGGGARAAVGMGRFLMNPIGAGIGLGVAGYEGLRKARVPFFRDLPSSYQIGQHYLGGAWRRLTGWGSAQTEQAATETNRPFERARTIGQMRSEQAIESLRLAGSSIAQNWKDAINAPQTEFSRMLESRFSGSVFEASKSAGEAINKAREAIERQRQGDSYDSEKQIAALHDLLKESRKQTGLMSGTAGHGVGGSDRVAAYMLLRYAKESSAALRRQGG